MSRIDAHAKCRHDLTDAQWELLAPLLPELPTTGRPRTYGLRGLVDAVRYRTRTGCPWRDIPDRYGPWWRAYALFRSWQVTGVWEHLERELASAVVTAPGPEAVWDEVSVDSTVCRAHVHAATAPARWTVSRTTTPWGCAGAGGRPRSTPPSMRGAGCSPACSVRDRLRTAP